MSLNIIPFTLGPLENNTYLLFDTASRSAAIVDPSFDSAQVVDKIRQSGWQLNAIWITHAHFDHIAGVVEVQKAWGSSVPVAIHPADLPVWDSGGGSRAFGIRIDPGPLPGTLLEDHQELVLGESSLEVLHIPGHSPGHVAFYSADAKALLCGDIIFQGSVGRTDLPGGDFDKLIEGIKQKVLTLPGETRLLPGHGPESTVARERLTNPFLNA